MAQSYGFGPVAFSSLAVFAIAYNTHPGNMMIDAEYHLSCKTGSPLGCQLEDFAAESSKFSPSLELSAIELRFAMLRVVIEQWPVKHPTEMGKKYHASAKRPSDL